MSNVVVSEAAVLQYAAASQVIQQALPHKLVATGLQILRTTCKYYSEKYYSEKLCSQYLVFPLHHLIWFLDYCVASMQSHLQGRTASPLWILPLK